MSELSSVRFVDREPATITFLHDVISGLYREPKQLPSKYFYDARGSRLFDQICELEEYYVTRTELAIMQRYAADMAAQLGSGIRLVEFGSGSSIKTRILLDHLDQPVAYLPVDISREHLSRIAHKLSLAYPLIEILPVCADFTADFALPDSQREPHHTAVYFPGSTIGNLPATEAQDLLSRIATLCGAGGGLLIGIDLQKDVGVLEAAYNDCRGITAEFNLNLLRRINRELNADFEPSQFEHVALYNETYSRIEMHLRSRCRQSVTVSGVRFRFARTEMICTEYSHKYTVDDFVHLAGTAGLRLRKCWTDPQRYFAVAHFVVDASWDR